MWERSSSTRRRIAAFASSNSTETSSWSLMHLRAPLDSLSRTPRRGERAARADFLVADAVPPNPSASFPPPRVKFDFSPVPDSRLATESSVVATVSGFSAPRRNSWEIDRNRSITGINAPATGESAYRSVFDVRGRSRVRTCRLTRLPIGRQVGLQCPLRSGSPPMSRHELVDPAEQKSK